MTDLSDPKTARELKGGTGLRRMINAVGYSVQGFRAAFRTEPAFRQLALLNMVLLPIALWVDVSPAERAILMVTPLLSLTIELINSSIEHVVDRISLELHPLSKSAKDMGSAAQFMGLVIIAVCWGVILI
ncbi:diacylglycerol kinase [Marinobacter zhanjiangensis]|uniref:Diacylglycerol kinase n=1 Tax=Marinobacter zhanjiangensis TaxID=578215 RepID=A0ABQ3B8W5_9GAMM|nr:diacylglycerol kinase [Marinobacter zhanjiangensis]GGY80590.1 diacylglycerol kinase [Marinobacter zhanjiangensis]